MSSIILIKCGVEAAMTGCNNGCSGGLMTNAYTYLINSGGLMEQRAYLYTGCRPRGQLHCGARR
jgi:hypothetical protein